MRRGPPPSQLPSAQQMRMKFLYFSPNCPADLLFLRHPFLLDTLQSSVFLNFGNHCFAEEKVRHRDASSIGPSRAEEESECLSSLLLSHPEEACSAATARDHQMTMRALVTPQPPGGLERHPLGEVRAGTVRLQGQTHSQSQKHAGIQVPGCPEGLQGQSRRRDLGSHNQVKGCGARPRRLGCRLALSFWSDTGSHRFVLKNESRRLSSI